MNGFDLAVAGGYVWDMLPQEFPVVLGRDFAGTVVGVGDGVHEISAAEALLARQPLRAAGGDGSNMCVENGDAIYSGPR